MMGTKKSRMCHSGGVHTGSVGVSGCQWLDNCHRNHVGDKFRLTDAHNPAGSHVRYKITMAGLLTYLGQGPRLPGHARRPVAYGVRLTFGMALTDGNERMASGHV